ncbi:MAG: hypothetical protein KGJ11_08730 [Candidatus Omnitrophica bacterium]|nr:hypothetical protein [Candidatus Omnitrophota bacterium]
MRSILITLCLTLALCGCVNPLNKGTLKSALNKYYKKAHPAIIKLDSFYCSSTHCTIDKSDYTHIRTMDLLVKAGLMNRREYYDPGNVNFMATNNDKSPNTVNYTYTNMGKECFKVVSTGPGMSDEGFAFGQESVIEVKNYTQPSRDMEGQTGLDVSYTVRTDNIVGWARSDEMKNAFPEIVQAFDSQVHPVAQESSMIKTANGWIDSRESL